MTHARITSILVGISLVLALAGAGQALAGNKYVKPGGTGSGSNWNDALGSLSSTTSAGDTYWVAAGTYNYFQVGANNVTIKRATVNDAAATGAAGWSAAFDGQVNVLKQACAGCGAITGIQRNGVTLDGRTRGGIKITLAPLGSDPNVSQSQINGLKWIGSNNTFKFIEFAGTATPAAQIGIGFGNGAIAWSTNNVISDCYFHDLNAAAFLGDMDHMTFERNEVYNILGNGANHDNVIYFFSGDNWIVRNNLVHRWGSMGFYFATVSWSVNNVEIYNNVMNNTANGSGIGVVIDAGGAAFGPNWTIVNNTFANIGSAMRFTRRAGGVPLTGGTIKNNLYFNCIPDTGASPVSRDYNWHRTANAYSAGEPHSIIGLGANPFVDLSGGNLRIVPAITGALPRNKGVSLGAPYNLDMDGSVRGADGLVDIGAYEVGSAAPPPPPPPVPQPPNTPTNSSPVSGATGVSITPTLTGSAYSDPTSTTQNGAQFLVYNAAGTTLVWDSGTLGQTTTTTVGTSLENSTAYTWKVRYRNAMNLWSTYSTPTAFTTAAPPPLPPNRPTIVSPVDGAVNTSLTPTLAASYSDPRALLQSASDWILTDQTGATTIYSTSSAGAVTSLAVPASLLSYSTKYAWKARFQNSAALWSPYSAVAYFTTTNAPTPPIPPPPIVLTNVTLEIRLNGDVIIQSWIAK